MSVVVGVHGIAQQRKGEDVLRSQWEPPLRDGLRRAGAAGEAALTVLGEQGLRCAFYGDLFRPPGRPLSVGDPFLTADDATDDDVELLTAWWTAAAQTDPAVQSPTARGLGTPRMVQAALRALSGARFFAGVSDRALLFDLAQVRRYLTEPDVRAAVRARVEAAVGDDTRVVVAHSLGSVVAYEVLCAHPEWRIDLFLTLGSPLGVRNVIFDRLDPRPVPTSESAGPRGRWPDCVSAWTNVADAGDVVALVKDLRPMFGTAGAGGAGGAAAGGEREITGYLVDNGVHAHDVSPYLTSLEAGRAVATALAARRPEAGVQ